MNVSNGADAKQPPTGTWTIFFAFLYMPTTSQGPNRVVSEVKINWRYNQGKFQIMSEDNVEKLGDPRMDDNGNIDEAFFSKVPGYDKDDD